MLPGSEVVPHLTQETFRKIKVNQLIYEVNANISSLAKHSQALECCDLICFGVSTGVLSVLDALTRLAFKKCLLCIVLTVSLTCSPLPFCPSLHLDKSSETGAG